MKYCPKFEIYKDSLTKAAEKAAHNNNLKWNNPPHAIAQAMLHAMQCQYCAEFRNTEYAIAYSKRNLRELRLKYKSQ